MTDLDILSNFMVGAVVLLSLTIATGTAVAAVVITIFKYSVVPG